MAPHKGLNLAGLLTATLTVVAAFFFINQACQVREIYYLRQDRIEKESWLRGQCADPATYARMRYHAHLCEEVENTARIGALWFAVNEVASSLPVLDTFITLQRASWPFWAGLALLLLLCPTLIIAQARAWSAPADLPVYRPTSCRPVV